MSRLRLVTDKTPEYSAFVSGALSEGIWCEPNTKVRVVTRELLASLEIKVGFQGLFLWKRWKLWQVSY